MAGYELVNNVWHPQVHVIDLTYVQDEPRPPESDLRRLRPCSPRTPDSTLCRHPMTPVAGSRDTDGHHDRTRARGHWRGVGVPFSLG